MKATGPQRGWKGPPMTGYAEAYGQPAAGRPESAPRTTAYQPASNEVSITATRNPHALSSQQTNADYNYGQALAYQQADPRFSGKQYQRGGISSSKGTASLGAAEAANRFASGMASAEMGRMKDAYANAGIRLDDADQRSQFSLALAGLQEDADHRERMYQIQSMQNSMGGIFGMGGGNSLLSGLL